MTVDQANEVIDALSRRHREKIDQLKNLFGSEDGIGVFELASKVMGNGINAADWLTRGQIGLNGAVPAVVALGPDGREAVRTYLMQIEYGVYV